MKIKYKTINEKTKEMKKWKKENPLQANRLRKIVDDQYEKIDKNIK